MMKQWLAVYKYRGHEKLEALFIEMLATAYSSHPAKRGITHITYVPVSEIRLLERGFNQAERLASGLGQKFGLPVIPLLERVRHTDKQSHKSRNERLADLEGAFAVREECLCRLLAGNSNRSLEILLIDDVYTTGSTMNQCACAITRHIRANVYGLTWAR